MTYLLAVFGLFFIAAIGAVWRGYVLSVLWGWFVASTFGLPELAVAAAIGISLMVSFLTYQADSSRDREGGSADRLINAVTVMVSLPAFALLFGWVIHLFV